MTNRTIGSNGRAASAAGSTLMVIVLACASTPDAERSSRTGCYYFERDQAAVELRLPWGVRLLDGPLEGWPALAQRPGVHPATTLRPTGETDHPFGYWAEASGDTIEVGHPGGGGLVLTLVPDGAGGRNLRGTARPVGDAVPVEGAHRPVRPVRLSLAQCPA